MTNIAVATVSTACISKSYGEDVDLHSIWVTVFLLLEELLSSAQSNASALQGPTEGTQRESIIVHLTGILPCVLLYCLPRNMYKCCLSIFYEVGCTVTTCRTGVLGLRNEMMLGCLSGPSAVACECNFVQGEDSGLHEVLPNLLKNTELGNRESIY